MLAGGFALLCAATASAITVTGSDWQVHFNLPDQNFSVVSGSEFVIRDALLARINSLQSGQTGTLSTYTFSGNSASAGAAGPIISAITRALNTGAVVRFIADDDVSITNYFNATNSLASLAARATNPLVLVQETNTSLIMHNKFALFDQGPGNRWVFTGSWNYTGGASTIQWNVAVAVRNDALYAAFAREAAEMLAGRFHGAPPKSRSHDKASFSIEGSWSNGLARFSPPTQSFAGGDHPLTDILTAISNAESEIFFALNQITLQPAAQAMVNAANRGILIHGVIPLSDAAPGESSSAIYSFLTTATNYITTNRVTFITPYSKADSSATDTGQSDLVHAKYMVIDPWGARPVTIMGSPNWTQQALTSTNGNDENILFIRHRDMTRMFYAHFRLMTGALTNRNDFWCSVDPATGTPRVALWTTDTNRYTLEYTSLPRTTGTPWLVGSSIITGRIGQLSFTNIPGGTSVWFRSTRTP
jgi:phosphatidylserine/phosphatidylglycerophosphate/cardiolipin synthase-like enzyme